MAKVYLSGEDYICANSNVFIYGSGATENVTILDDVYNVTIYNTVESVTLSRSKSSYVINKGFSGEDVYLDNKLVCKTSTIDVTIKFSGVDLRAYTNGVDNQSTTNSCTAFAVTTMMEIYNYKLTGIDKSYSALFNYYTSRTIHNQSGVIEDVGSRIYKAVQAIKLYGIVEEKDYPYDIGKVNDVPPLEVWEIGRNNKPDFEFIQILNSGDIVEAPFVKEVLDDGLAIAFTLTIGREFYELANKKLEEMNYVGIDNISQVDSNHAMCIVGYDDNLNGGSFIVENSWGKEWGDNGFLALKYDVLNKNASAIYYIKD